MIPPFWTTSQANGPDLPQLPFGELMAAGRLVLWLRHPGCDLDRLLDQSLTACCLHRNKKRSIQYIPLEIQAALKKSKEE